MPKKKGPPYVDDPECKYVVVENPWPSIHYNAARNSDYYQEVGTWLRYALNKAAYPETIYSRKTRSDLVVKFSEDVDITPLLGAHYWPNFLKQRDAKRESSCIFEFNYRQHGHPETHQWAGQEIDLQDPPRWRGVVPFKQPYHPPAYADLRRDNLSCRDLGIPMPVPREDDVVPDPQPEVPQPKPQERQSRDRSLFSFVDAIQPKVEEAPAPGPSGGLAAARPRQQREAPAPASRPPPPPVAEPNPDQQTRDLPSSRISKFDVDPYEQDEAAASFLKAEPTDLRLPPLGAAVKREAGSAHVKPDPGPSDELRREFDEYQRALSSAAANVEGPAKDEPYVPSAELIAEFNELQSLGHWQEPVRLSPALHPATLAFKEEQRQRQAARGNVKYEQGERYRRQPDPRRWEDRRQEPSGRLPLKPESDAESSSFRRDRQHGTSASRAPSYAPARPEIGSNSTYSAPHGTLDRSSAAVLAQSSESRMQGLRDRMRRESERDESTKRERGSDDSGTFKRRRF